MTSSPQAQHPGPRQRTPGEKLKTVSDMWWTARALKLATLRSLHPDWSEERLRQEVRRVFLLAR